MGRALISGSALLAAATVAAALPGAGASGSSSKAVQNLPLRTAVMPEFGDPQQAETFAASRAAGASSVRLILWWPNIAPEGDVRPAAFDARSASDPLYRWTAFDTQVKAAAKVGLSPIVSIVGAPAWTQDGKKTRESDGPVYPSPNALGDFATAVAKRYAGGFRGLPRVRYWQVWNEPNLSIQLMPQSENGKPVSPDWYRDMVNAMARAVHAVRPDNVVVAGGLAPFGGSSNDPSGGYVPTPERIHPLEFMRQMLCMSKGIKPKPTCNAQTEFDVWAHHPYTYGGPTHSAFHPDDVSMGDLGEMRALLTAAARAGHVKSGGEIGFWVTEFSYDSQPGDPKGLPPVLHARWVSEALYRMWSNGVSLVTWFLIRDQPFPGEMFQSGLYTVDDRPKLALRAFRFPFVAFRQKDQAITYWGRTPSGTKKAVAVEQKQGARWVRLVSPTVDRYGIFQGRIATARGKGSLRSRLVDRSDVSLPFSQTVPEDFRFCPWGSRC